MASAPVIGGFINEVIGWQGNYIFVMIFTLLVFLLQITTLPETKNDNLKPSIAKILSSYKHLLKNLSFLSYALMPSLLFAAYMAYIASSAFLYKGTFNLGNYAFVIHQSIIISTFSICSIFASRIIKFVGENASLYYGISLCAMSAILLVIQGLLPLNSEYYMTGFMLLFSIGFAIFYPVAFSRSLSFLPHFQGTASSIVMSARALLVFCFTSWAGFLFDGSLIRVTVPIATGIIMSFVIFIAHRIRS